MNPAFVDQVTEALSDGHHGLTSAQVFGAGLSLLGSEEITIALVEKAGIIAVLIDILKEIPDLVLIQVQQERLHDVRESGSETEDIADCHVLMRVQLHL